MASCKPAQLEMESDLRLLDFTLEQTDQGFDKSLAAAACLSKTATKTTKTTGKTGW